jgi:hypothetical protein
MEPMGLFMRPGYTLLLAGIVSFFGSRYIDIVPLIGNMLQYMMFFFGVFGLIGGVWLIVANRRAGIT